MEPILSRRNSFVLIVYRRTIEKLLLPPVCQALERGAGLFSAVRLESGVPYSTVICRRRRGLIPRYTRPEMGRIWSDENRFRTWLAVEVAATETLAAEGMVPKHAAKAIRERADFKLERILEIEAEVRHHVIAFTTAGGGSGGPGGSGFYE